MAKKVGAWLLSLAALSILLLTWMRLTSSPETNPVQPGKEGDRPPRTASHPPHATVGTGDGAESGTPGHSLTALDEALATLSRDLDAAESPGARAAHLIDDLLRLYTAFAESAERAHAVQRLVQAASDPGRKPVLRCLVLIILGGELGELSRQSIEDLIQSPDSDVALFAAIALSVKTNSQAANRGHAEIGEPPQRGEEWPGKRERPYWHCVLLQLAKQDLLSDEMLAELCEDLTAARGFTDPFFVTFREGAPAGAVRDAVLALVQRHAASNRVRREALDLLQGDWSHLPEDALPPLRRLALDSSEDPDLRFRIICSAGADRTLGLAKEALISANDCTFRSLTITLLQAAQQADDLFSDARLEAQVRTQLAEVRRNSNYQAAWTLLTGMTSHGRGPALDFVHEAATTNPDLRIRSLALQALCETTWDRPALQARLPHLLALSKDANPVVAEQAVLGFSRLVTHDASKGLEDESTLRTTAEDMLLTMKDRPLAEATRKEVLELLSTLRREPAH